MKTHIHTSLKPKLRAEWDALWALRPLQATAANSSAWLVAAQEAFGHRDIRIVAVYGDNDQLVAVASLVRYRMYGTVVYGAPAQDFADKPSVLVDWNDTEAVAALATAFKQIGTVYLAECDGKALTALTRADAQAAFFQDDFNAIVTFTPRNAYGDLSKNELTKIKKRISKVSEPVTMRHSITSHEAMLATAFEIESESTKNARGMKVLGRPEVQTFFQTLSSVKPELMHVSVLNIGTRSVAFSIDLLAHGMYHGSQKAFLNGFDAIAPGKYLVMKLFEYYHEKGYTGIDLGRGYDSLKRQFSAQANPLYTVILGNATTGSYLSFMRTTRIKVYDSVVRQKVLYRTFKAVRSILPI